MAKLSTARDFRKYGPHATRNQWEYVNAGIYIVATVLLVAGVVAQEFPAGIDGKSGLAVIFIGILLIAIVNAHDLIAHLVGIDFSIQLVEFDTQLALVEISVPLWLIVGDVLSAVAVIFLLLIAGPVFWVLGSVQNLCEVYERSNGLLQNLQKSVQIPFLLGSFLFLLGGIFNRHEIFHHHSFKLLGKSWGGLSLFGSLLFLIGGLMNIVKVFKMQQMDRGEVENLRGGALERLIREREGRVPLILEESRRRQPSSHGSTGGATPTPYKDVLVSGGGGA